MFKLKWMYSDYYKCDAWFVARVNEKDGEPDYYGPYISKKIAENNLAQLNGE